jgi:hypothetical protein
MELDPRVSEAAGKMLTDPAFRTVCERLEERYAIQWKTSEPTDSNAREEAYRRFRSLIEMLRDMRGLYEAGEAEKLAAERKAKLEASEAASE